MKKRDKHCLALLELHLLARRTFSTPSRRKFVPPSYPALLTLLKVSKILKLHSLFLGVQFFI